MPRVYHLADGELPVVQAFLNLSHFPLEQSWELPGEETLKEAVSSLMSKQYLRATPDGKHQLDRMLAFLLTAADHAHGIFKMRHSGGKRCVLAFVNDTIVLLQEQGGGVEAMWLPHLPLAIGFVANTLEPFLNETTGAAEAYDTADIEQVIDGLTAWGYELCWSCSTQCCVEALNSKCYILSNVTEQILLTTQNEGVRACRPSKEELVNSLTRMFAPIHASAIKQGGVLDGSV